MLTTNLARGGAETQVALLAAGLRRRDWDVSVISLVRPTAFERSWQPLVSLSFRWAWSLGCRNPLGYARLLRSCGSVRPQILHGHMFHANLLARLRGFSCPLPVVISTLHSVAESGARSPGVRLAGPRLPAHRSAGGSHRRGLRGRVPRGMSAERGAREASSV